MVRKTKSVSRLCSLLASAILLLPTAVAAQDEVVYYHTDAVGSVRMVTDAAGTVIARYDYTTTCRSVSDLEPSRLQRTSTSASSPARSEMPKRTSITSAHATFAGSWTVYDRGSGAGYPDSDAESAKVEPLRVPEQQPLRKVDPKGGYEIDVHLYLTRVLARAAGVDKATAERIGAADQGVDDNPNTGPFKDIAARRDFHFASAARRTQLWDAFEKTGSPEDLGVFFHAQQDSFSHEGFGPTLGHLSAGHRPNKTFNAPDKADAMARDTYDRLRAAISHLGGTGGRALPWEKVRPYISRFNRATEVDEKYRILDELTRAIETSA